MAVDWDDFYRRVYRDYYTTHVLPRKGPVTLASLADAAASHARHFGEFLPDDKGAEILDVGCGNGSLAWFLQQRGYDRAEGIDLCEEQLRAARDLGVRNLACEDMFDRLGRSGSRYNLLFMRDVLEHLEMPRVLHLVDLCFAALKPGGKVVIMTPNGESPLVGRVRYGDITHRNAFTQVSMAQLFRLAGFRQFSFKPFEPPMSFPRKVAWMMTKAAFRWFIVAENGRCNPIVTCNLISCAVKEE